MTLCCGRNRCVPKLIFQRIKMMSDLPGTRRLHCVWDIYIHKNMQMQQIKKHEQIDLY